MAIIHAPKREVVRSAAHRRPGWQTWRSLIGRRLGPSANRSDA